jgi:5'-methylthioadenosine phosphorylase
MSNITIGIIAGSGLNNLPPFDSWQYEVITTEYGSVEVKIGNVSERKVIFLARHGITQHIPAHLVNHKANISALVKYSAKKIIGVCAAGSLRTDIQPGSAAVLSDFIDFTRKYPATIFDTQNIPSKHTDFSRPYCDAVSLALFQSAGNAGFEVITPCTYISVDGPRYETPAEIRLFRSWGADVVGMTGAPEAIICKEADVCYGAMAVITNYGAGLANTRLSHDEVIQVMKSVEDKISQTLLRTIELVPVECNHQ